MKKLYGTAIALGAILTPIAHKIATANRGYDAIGGEIFIIPLLFMAVFSVDEAKSMTKEIKKIWSEEEKEWA